MRVAYHGVAGSRLRSAFDDAADRHGLDITVIDPHDDAAIDAVLDDLEVWWHVLTPITAAHLDRAPDLRLIQKWGVGVNTIDVEAASRRGVPVANMPGSNASAVAEATVMLMLAALRSLTDYHRATSTGVGWAFDPDVAERSAEMAGRTVGLVGFGDIAQRVARVASALGAEVVHHSRRTDRPGWRPLDELLSGSDIVSLHVPLTAETHHLLDTARLASMAPHAVLINTARGGLVDSTALAEALVGGRLGAAGLDVFESEPLSTDDPLATAPRVTRMPHVAWLTWETLSRSLDIAVENVERVRRGDDPVNRVRV